MTNEQITGFLKPEYFGKSRVSISFKTRQGLTGIFIQSADFNELRSKNLWRIISESRIDEFLKSKDSGLARIFNGVEITRLSIQ